MYQIDNATAATVEPNRGAVGPNPGSFFTVGSAAGNTPATVVDADWLNMLQNELAAVLAAAGIAQNKANDAQLLAVLTGWVGRNAQTFTASGSFTVPSGVTKVRVRIIGGGGAGGGSVATSSSQTSIGAPGSSGSYAEGIYTVTPGQVIAVTVGAGGVANVGAGGGNGQTSSFGAMISAPGGRGGATPAAQSSSNFFGGGGTVGTQPSGGTITNDAGDVGGVSLALGGSGFGAQGGSGPFGGGGQGVGTGAGLAATGTGSGGGGSFLTVSSAAVAGGAGFGGKVIVEW